MAWNRVSIKIGDSEIQGHQSSTASNCIFSIPAPVDLSEGDSFSVGKKSLIATRVVDLAGRGETLLVEAKESKNDKRTKGRSDPDDGGSADSGEDDS